MQHAQPSRRTKILWAFLLGFALQLVVPLALAKSGFPNAALWATWPGLLPIVRMTGGWFSELSLLGYVIVFSINTLVYAAAIYLAISVLNPYVGQLRRKEL